MADRDAKGRHGWAKRTHCIRGHEYTPENTTYQKRGHRVCKACQLQNSRNSYAKYKRVPGGRVYQTKTHCVRGHEFRSGSYYVNSRAERVCKACVKVRAQAGHAHKIDPPNPDVGL
ncbi:MAG TPA: hypothetical protein VNM48_03895 [Chloroflexota bacterium]|nr:hypothetical protein [Chloroflexota bacterium]